ncbi:MAG: hypothetical protein ACFB9M_19320 [Myxococcota bacterium]
MRRRFGRRLLLAGVAGAATGAVGLGVGWRPSRLYIVALEIRREFAFLRVDQEAVLRFLEDYEEAVRAISKRSALPGVPLDPGVSERFLLSTDLFPSADVRRDLKYTGLYGWMACASPTSHGPLSDEELARGEGRETFLARHPEYR